ncbi:MAG TPA: lipopolysaccharide biosynthesis protein [Candidatus Acidoferrales bacterium]|nr:lipopolysaccharide biosynthesis protein [Candidatus Acidoferrales bacterium]
MPAQEQLLDAFSTAHLQADLRGRSVRAGLVTLTSQGTQFFMQSIATVVLARLLTPGDFGLVAMVTAVTGLGSAFADLGLSEATIQREEITHDQVNALFWINVAIGVGLMVVTMALAPVLAWLYREPRLVHITLLLSFTFLISGLRVQPDALLRRQMRFASLAIRDVAAYALAVPLAITMAWRGSGYWALVALPVTLNLTGMILSWLMVKWRPGLPRRNANVRSLVVFGRDVAASYLLFNVNRSVDNVLIGWYWGAAPLGLYSRAYNLLMLPVRQLNAPAASVAVPAFSRIQCDPERYARYYLRAISLIVWVCAPLFGFLFTGASPVIVLLLGAQWQGAAPVFQILAISALGQLLLESTVWLLVSRGQADRLLKLLLIISPIIIGSFVIGLPFGIKGVALSYSVVLLAILPWILKFAFRGTTLTLPRLGRVLLYPVLFCLLGICLARLALHWIGPERPIPQLLVVGLGFAIAYLVSAFIRPAREEITSLRKIIAELRPSSQTT